MIRNMFSKPVLRLSVIILMNENLWKISTVSCKNVIQRHYARWSIRKPSKVVLPEEISSGSIKSEDFLKSEYLDDSSDVTEKKSRKEKNSESNESQKCQRIKKSEEGSDYITLGENDFTFSKLMSYVGNRNMRRKQDIMMLEGKRLNIDALEAKLKPKKIFFTQTSIVEELKLKSLGKLPLYKIPYKTMKLWSKLDTPPGIMGFYSIPKEGDIVPVNSLPIKVLCDNIRDPNNLGAIIRVAASVGCKEIILMKGCTDPWDSKVIRCASGGHFHVPITMDLEWQNQREFLDPSDVVFVADSHSTREYPPSCSIPLHLYYDVSYTLGAGAEIPASVVVVIGGETEGLSREAFALATRRKGCRLYVPLSNNMESLNTGSALSVVLFEIKKQFLLGKGDLKNDTTKDTHCQDEDDRKPKRSHMIS